MSVISKLLDVYEKNPFADEEKVLNVENLSWQCMACKEERLDRFITVTKIEVPDDGRSVPFVFNFRHCVDRVPCTALANRTRSGEYLIAEEP